MLGNTEEGEEWKLMPQPLVVIDSGAAKTVMPTDWFTGHELKETEESRGGQFYVCAGGKEIPNYGERTLTLSTLDCSSIRNMTYQVTDVTKALGSVSKIVANGNKVVFDGSGSFLENKIKRSMLAIELKAKCHQRSPSEDVHVPHSIVQRVRMVAMSRRDRMVAHEITDAPFPLSEMTCRSTFFEETSSVMFFMM